MPIYNPAEAAAPTREFFLPATLGTLGGTAGATYRRASIILNAAGEYACMTFEIPWDFTAIVSAEIIVIPLATQANANWDIGVYYASVGEAATTHSETDAATTYNVTNGQVFAVDVSGILTAIAPGDNAGMYLAQQAAGHNVAVLGIRFRYN